MLAKRGKPQIPQEEIAKLCARHHLRKLYLFGSILTDEFDEESDVDVMIEYTAVPSPRELVEMREELEAMFGREVDLVTRRAVERSESSDSRESILNTASLVFAAS